MGSINLIELVIKKEGMKFGKRCVGSSVEVRRKVAQMNIKQGALHICATFLRIKGTATNHFFKLLLQKLTPMACGYNIGS